MGRKPKSIGESLTPEEIKNMNFAEVLTEIKDTIHPTINERAINQQENQKLELLLQHISNLHITTLEKIKTSQERIIELQSEKNILSSRKTYAEIMSKHIDKQDKSLFVNKSNFREIILKTNYENGSKENTDDTKIQLMKTLSPTENKLNVENCQILRNGKIKILLLNEEQFKKVVTIIETKNQSEHNFSIELRKKILPKIEI